MPTTHGFDYEPAMGICDECGNMVHFNANDRQAQCQVCMAYCTRTTSGAVTPSAQRVGYRVGEGVTPRCAR